MSEKSLYTRLISGLIFPLQEKLKKHDTVAIHEAHEKSQWWTPGELERYRLERLRRFLQDVGSHVPYYQALFAQTGFAPERLQNIADLRQLPFLTKSLIRENTQALTSTQAVDLARFNTGGSSGEPLIFYIGKERVSHDVAAKWRATRWWDVDIGDPEIVVWGSPIELGAQDRMRHLRDSLMRTELLPAFEMSAARLDEFVARIRQRRPRMLFGYPSSLSLIARHARKQGIAMNDLGIKVAFVTSERLYDEQREIIEAVFQCPVANGYGSRDAGFIAHQCPSGSMHITAEDIIVEIVDANGQPVPPGQAGEIVVTHMATGDFPFIRYRTGDVAVMDDQPCACGRGLPVLKEIQGRATDFVIAQDGTVMHGLALIYTLRDIHGIEAFKIIQESLQLTRVEIVVAPHCDLPAAKTRIVRELGARLGANVEIDVQVVPEIPAEKSGKYRYVISKVGT
ncbi:MAG: phenylacetate--CoA ligase family protein [Rhodocyclales bacterium GT-UBC]|nr:MAG: phenylacetate--CoA ligase family protein [Rhodocyclales bacterium GT-UBC]